MATGSVQGQLEAFGQRRDPVGGPDLRGQGQDGGSLLFVQPVIRTNGLDGGRGRAHEDTGWVSGASSGMNR